MITGEAPPRCTRNWKRGWWCSREAGHSGPCALRPRWWKKILSGPLGVGWLRWIGPPPW